MKSRQIAIAALMIALTFVTTYITGFIRTPLPGGYLNLGDAIIFISALLFGPAIGFFAGSIGSALSDLLYGSLVFVPGTFFIKGIEGLIVAIVFRELRKSKLFVSLTVLIVGLIVMISSLYFGFITNIESSLRYFFFSTGLSFMVVGIFLGISKKFEEDLIMIGAMILGGIEMVTGYFIYEFLIFGYLAFAEIILNTMQAIASLIAAYLILKSRALVKP